MLNNPPVAVEKKEAGMLLENRYSAIWCEEEHVVIEVVKEAEEGTDRILRLYKSCRMKS